MNHREIKRAFITGITGQDGSYLAEFLLTKGYEVHGLARSLEENALKHATALYKDGKITLHEGSVCDRDAVRTALEKAQPDEIYNLAAQSHDMQSFSSPEETFQINCEGLGVIVEEAMRLNPKVKIFQASSSEIFGNTNPPQNEHSPYNPVSPYGKAKQTAHEKYVVGFRNKGLFICSGILFNHESSRRGQDFVTQKIVQSLVNIKKGTIESFELGNVDTKRDWGYAPDYVQAMWLMLQTEVPEDFVIATGKVHTVRDFFNEVVTCLDMKVTWEGEGLHEVVIDEAGKVILRINEKYYRPVSIDYSLGDNTHIKKILGWEPTHSFTGIVKIMVDAEVKNINDK